LDEPNYTRLVVVPKSIIDALFYFGRSFPLFHYSVTFARESNNYPVSKQTTIDNPRHPIDFICFALTHLPKHEVHPPNERWHDHAINHILVRSNINTTATTTTTTPEDDYDCHGLFDCRDAKPSS
jgi:hypothetical protein